MPQNIDTLARPAKKPDYRDLLPGDSPGRFSGELSSATIPDLPDSRSCLQGSTDVLLLV